MWCMPIGRAIVISQLCTMKERHLIGVPGICARVAYLGTNKPNRTRLENQKKYYIFNMLIFSYTV